MNNIGNEKCTEAKNVQFFGFCTFNRNNIISTIYFKNEKNK